MSKLEDGKKRIALVLSGCGFRDGSEIHESVLTMLAIDRGGGAYKCFAPDIDQARVFDHYNKVETEGKRNVLVESARIARCDITPLSEFRAEDFDALILPGGAGAILNLVTFAKDGPECSVNEDLQRVIESVHQAKKPIGALCISPVILARIIKGAEVTVGDSSQLAESIERMGAVHKNTGHEQVVVDSTNRLVTTPCYMLNSSISQIAAGADNLVKEIFGLM